MRSMIVDEARTAARVQHEHCVRLFGVVELPRKVRRPRRRRAHRPSHTVPPRDVGIDNTINAPPVDQTNGSVGSQCGAQYGMVDCRGLGLL